MKITMNNWQVDTRGQRSIGYEGDHLAHTLTVETDLKEAWALKLDLRYPEGGAPNVVDLVRSGSDYTVVLTRDILRQDGMYTCQLRGLLGESVRHSNTVYLYVNSAINAIDAVPPMAPAEMAQMEARVTAVKDEAEQAADRAEAASLHYPKLGDNSNWFVWDLVLGQCTDTGVYSGGEAPYIGTNGNWFVGQNDTGVRATGPVGPPGATGNDGRDGADGKDGLPGKDGTDGMPGKDGGKGNTGATGRDGPQGPAGVSGLLQVTRTSEWQLGLSANTCTVIEGAPLALAVTLGEPVTETDTEWRLIFKAGSNFHLEDTAPEGYVARWESEPGWVEGKIYEISYGNTFLPGADGNTVIGVLWRVW